MELLREHGLTDGDGNVLSDWSGEIYIHDGEEPRHTSVEELTALLEDEAVSRDTAVTVDGTEITLGGFETILEIQREIGRIRKTYLQDEVELTSEQASSLYSLYEQLSEEGIQLCSANGADALVFPSGIDHSVAAEIVGSDTAALNGSYTFQVKLNKAQTPDVTFSYAAHSGSVEASGAGTGTIPAGQTETTVTVQVGQALGRTQGKGAFVVSVNQLENALFADGAAACSKTVTMNGLNASFKYADSKNFSFNISGKQYSETVGMASSSSGDSAVKDMTNPDTERGSASVSFSGLDAGSYEAAVTVNSFDLTHQGGEGEYEFWGNYNRYDKQPSDPGSYYFKK